MCVGVERMSTALCCGKVECTLLILSPTLLPRRLVFDVPQSVTEVRDAAAVRLGAELYSRSLGCNASGRAQRGSRDVTQLLIGEGNIESKALTSLSCTTNTHDPLHQLHFLPYGSRVRHFAPAHDSENAFRHQVVLWRQACC